MDEQEIRALGSVHRGDLAREAIRSDDVGSDLHLGFVHNRVVIRMEGDVDDLAPCLPREVVAQRSERRIFFEGVAPFSVACGGGDIVPELDVRAGGGILDATPGVADVHVAVPAAVNQHREELVFCGLVITP